MSFSDLCGLDLKALSEFGLVCELAGVSGQRAVVGGDDLVVHGEVGCTGGAAVVLDGLFNAQLGCLVFVDKSTGDGCCLVGGRASNILEAHAPFCTGHCNVLAHAVNALHVLEVPLVIPTGRDFLLFDGEVRVTDFEGDEGRVVLSVGLTKTGGGQCCKRVGCGHVGAARRSGRGRGLGNRHGAGGFRRAARVVAPGVTGSHREVGGGDRRVGTRGVLDGLHDAHRALLGDDAIEAGVVNRELLSDEVIRGLGVRRNGGRAVSRRNGVEVLRRQEVGRILRGDKAPEVQTVGAPVLREGLVRDGLLQLNGVGDVGVLVDVTLGARPIARRYLFLHELIVRLLCTAVVVLAVQVVVTVTLTHVLDTVHASRAGFRLVDVTLRAIGSVDRVRLISGANEIARGRVSGTTIGTIEDQVTDPPSTDQLIHVPAVSTKLRRAEAGHAIRLHVGATLAVNDRRGQGVEGLVVNEGEGFALVPRNQASELQIQARDEVGLAKTAGGSRLSNRQVVVANRAKKEGLPRLNLARVIRLEADGGLAVHPDVLWGGSPLVIVRLHPGLAGCSITIVAGLVIPLPRCTAGDIGPCVPILSGFATEPGG